MIFLQAFIHSLKLPSKQAMFRLNRIGMDITLIYMFILLLFVSIPELVDRIIHPAGLSAGMPVFFLLIYFFIFYYLPLTIIFLLLLCVIAYIGTFIAQALHRKLKFSTLWKLIAFATTIPVILFTFIAFFYQMDDLFILLFSVYICLFMIKMITVFPKRKKKKHSARSN